MLRAQRREERVLREEAPARVQRGAARLHGGLHDALDVEIRLRRACRAEHHDLAALGVRRRAIGLADGEHRHDAECVTGACDPDGNFPAIGDQQAMKQRWHREGR